MVKNYLLLSIGALWVSTSLAQTQKGNGLISGSLSVHYNQQKEPFYDNNITRDKVTTN